MKILQICPPHLSDVATLPWDIQKSHYEKDWKHVLMQKVVTLNTCCDIACLTFQLPHVTTGVFRVTEDNPQLALFIAFNIQTAGLAFGGTGLCSCRVRGVDGSCAKRLTV